MPRHPLPPRPRRLTHVCAAPGCQLPIWRDRSRFCGRHMNVVQRHGHPVAKAIPDSEFESCRQWIDDGLAKYEGTKGCQAALRLADDLLNYAPPQQFTVFLEIQRRMQTLRVYGVKPIDVVRRVTAYVAYIQLRPRPDQNSEDFGLACAVIRLAPLGTYRPNCRLLRFMGEMIRERLYRFAGAFLQRLESDAAAQRALLIDSRDFDSLHTQEATP